VFFRELQLFQHKFSKLSQVRLEMLSRQSIIVLLLYAVALRQEMLQL
jgi:hypothetical protein